MDRARPKRIVVVAEHTPNPHALKLDVGFALAPPPGADFPDPVAALRGSPLAARLFEIPGVCRVMVGTRFVTITKDPAVEWAEVAGRAELVLKAHLEAGEPALLPGFVSEAHTHDADQDSATIRRILEQEIRPAVARDGGDVLFRAYRDGVLELDLRGSCADCPSSIRTLKLGIEARLREVVPGLREVVAAGS